MKTNLKEVVAAVALFAKRQQRRGKSVVCDVKPSSISKPSSASSKSDDSTIDELIKGTQELKIKMAKLEEKNH